MSACFRTSEAMKATVGAAIGAMLGFLLVRSFFLNPIEEIGVRLFFDFLGGGGPSDGAFDLGKLFEFEATWKLLAGMVIGGAGGWLAGSRVQLSGGETSGAESEG